jgi:hypothetical protein
VSYALLLIGNQRSLVGPARRGTSCLEPARDAAARNCGVPDPAIKYRQSIDTFNRLRGS